MTNEAPTLRRFAGSDEYSATETAIFDAAADEIERLRDAAIMARDTLLFFHEMGGYVAENVRTVIHAIDKALGHEPTVLRLAGEVSDHRADDGTE